MSNLEETLLLYIRANELPLPEREYKFHPKRKWLFDFCYPDLMLAIEVEGGTRKGGRHSRHDGYTKDCEKYNEALILGYRVIRVTSDHVYNGAAIDWIRRALRKEGEYSPPPF